MRIYIVSTDLYGYDEYDSFVVSAENEEDAKKMGVSEGLPCNYEEVDIEYIGEYRIEKSELIHSSFNAG